MRDAEAAPHIAAQFSDGEKNVVLAPQGSTTSKKAKAEEKAVKQTGLF